MSIARGIKSLFLTEFVSAFFLSMRYFFAPKSTINYPHEKNPTSPVSYTHLTLPTNREV